MQNRTNLQATVAHNSDGSTQIQLGASCWYASSTNVTTNTGTRYPSGGTYTYVKTNYNYSYRYTNLNLKVDYNGWGEYYNGTNYSGNTNYGWATTTNISGLGANCRYSSIMWNLTSSNTSYMIFNGTFYEGNKTNYYYFAGYKQ